MMFEFRVVEVGQDEFLGVYVDQWDDLVQVEVLVVLAEHAASNGGVFVDLPMPVEVDINQINGWVILEESGNGSKHFAFNTVPFHINEIAP